MPRLRRDCCSGVSLLRGTLFYFLYHMKYFSIDECTRSDTAAAHGVSNLPTDEHRQHLVEMIEELLDPLREAWGVVCEEESLGDPALRVSSGYRSDALNKLVGGSSTSAHSVGYAVDLIPANSDISRFRSFCAGFPLSVPYLSYASFCTFCVRLLLDFAQRVFQNVRRPQFFQPGKQYRHFFFCRHDFYRIAVAAVQRGDCRALHRRNSGHEFFKIGFGDIHFQHHPAARGHHGFKQHFQFQDFFPLCRILHGGMRSVHARRAFHDGIQNAQAVFLQCASGGRVVDNHVRVVRRKNFGSAVRSHNEIAEIVFLLPFFSIVHLFGCQEDALAAQGFIVHFCRNRRHNPHFVKAEIEDFFHICAGFPDPVRAGKSRVVCAQFQKFADVLRLHHFGFQIVLIHFGAVGALRQADGNAGLFKQPGHVFVNPAFRQQNFQFFRFFGFHAGSI